MTLGLCGGLCPPPNSNLTHNICVGLDPPQMPFYFAGQICGRILFALKFKFQFFSRFELTSIFFLSGSQIFRKWLLLKQ
jgi:hypothetical protein